MEADIPEYCPKGSRIYIITLISLILTSLLISVNIFSGANRAGEMGVNSKFAYKDIASQEPVKKDLFEAGIAVSVISVIYTVYIIAVTFFDETWETTGLSKYINYQYIISGGVDVHESQLESFTKDVPCYVRKQRSCDVEPNTRECYWDHDSESCTRTYTGGYGNTLIFLGCSIYLIVFGITILSDQKDLETSDEFTTLATISIVAGVIGILYTGFDIIIC